MTIILLGYESHSNTATPKVLYAGRKKSEMLKKQAATKGKIVRFEIIENPTVVNKSNPNSDERAKQEQADLEAREAAEAAAEADRKAAHLEALQEEITRVEAERSDLIAVAESEGDEETLSALLTAEEIEAREEAKAKAEAEAKAKAEEEAKAKAEEEAKAKKADK